MESKQSQDRKMQMEQLNQSQLYSLKRNHIIVNFQTTKDPLVISTMVATT